MTASVATLEAGLWGSRCPVHIGDRLLSVDGIDISQSSVKDVCTLLLMVLVVVTLVDTDVACVCIPTVLLQASDLLSSEFPHLPQRLLEFLVDYDGGGSPQKQEPTRPASADEDFATECDTHRC